MIIRLRHYERVADRHYDSVIILLRPDGTIRWVEKFNIGTTREPLSNVDMTPDGKYLVVGSKDTYIYLLTDFPETSPSKPRDSTEVIWSLIIAGFVIFGLPTVVVILAINYFRKHKRALTTTYIVNLNWMFSRYMQ